MLGRRGTASNLMARQPSMVTMVVTPQPKKESFMDRTFKPGKVFRAMSITGIFINFSLFVIGFVITAFAARLGAQEVVDVEFTATVGAGGSTAPQSDSYYSRVERSFEAISGLTIGLTVLGLVATFTAIMGICGSVRGSYGILYCYVLMIVVMILSQAMLVGSLTAQVQDIQVMLKNSIDMSTSAKELVLSKGRQARFLGMLMILFEFLGFVHALILRLVIRKTHDEEIWGEEMADLTKKP